MSTDTPPPAPRPVTLTECEQDCIEAIRQADHRLTTEEVKRHLQESGKIHGDSTVVTALANLCKRKGRLTNYRDDRGKGYGLAEWISANPY